jgi:3-oxoacyl-[acyl-carrier-protein] synthase II
MIQGKSGIRTITSFDTSQFANHKGGEIKDFDPSGYVRKESIGRVGRASQFAIAATKMGLAEAKIAPSETDQDRIGVSMGATVGEGQVMRTINTEWVSRGRNNVPKDLFFQYPSWSITANVAVEFGFNGPNLMVPTACAAGNYAIGRACDLIKAGRADIMVAGGSDALSFVAFAGFNKLLSMAPEMVQPFDKNRKGMMIGEGAAVLILESYPHALKRGANIIAEIIGYGFGCDAYHMVTPHPDGKGAITAIHSALKMAGISYEHVDYINAHGTGTTANDLAETIAIKRAFKEKAHKIPVSSIKSMIAHTMGAASAIEAAACCLAVQHDLIPPTINYHEPDPECDLDYVPNAARAAKVNIAMSNAFAFGGNTASLLLRKPSVC